MYIANLSLRRQVIINSTNFFTTCCNSVFTEENILTNVINQTFVMLVHILSVSCTYLQFCTGTTASGAWLIFLIASISVGVDSNAR